MADYEDLVELGFEGVDKFATHFHDPVVGFVGKHKPFSSHSRKKHAGGSSAGHQQRERPRELPKEEIPPPQGNFPQAQEPRKGSDLPPHPQLQVPPPPPGPGPGPPYTQGPRPVAPYPSYPAYPAYPTPQPVPYPSSRVPLPRQRSYSEPQGQQHESRSVDNRYQSDPEDVTERESDSMYPPYAPNRRRDGDWREDDRYERVVEDREYYGPSGTIPQMVARTRDVERRPRAPEPLSSSPPSDYRYAPSRGCEDERAVGVRPSPRRQRSSSWSPPRRSERRHQSPRRRVRSKSPNHHRALAVVLGALAGGVAGSRVKKSDPVPNTVATVGGAIFGGIAARELEQEYDKHKERRAYEAYERGEARERRRLEREYD